MRKQYKPWGVFLACKSNKSLLKKEDYSRHFLRNSFIILLFSWQQHKHKGGHRSWYNLISCPIIPSALNFISLQMRKSGIKKKLGMQAPLPDSPSAWTMARQTSPQKFQVQFKSFFHPCYPNQPTSSRAIVVEALVDLVVRWQRELMGCLRSYWLV